MKKIKLFKFQTQSNFAFPTSGLFHYLRETETEKSRIHLRIDPDRHGTLIINANRIMHLNPTAALMAYHILELTPEKQIIGAVKQKYNVSTAQANSDLQTIKEQLEELIRPDGACPIHELGLETVAPFSARPSAPYRMDLALTYRCNNDCAHCYNPEHPPHSEQHTELSTEKWKQILDKTWELGIPHIIFTGGEPTLRNDLPELIAYAEEHGQITGLNTNARRLADDKFLQQLVDAGLDHIQITLESSDEEIHNQMVRAKAFQQTIRGLKNALKTRLFIMTNTTMLQNNAASIPATLDFLAELGVPTVGLNALIYSGQGARVGTGLPDSALPGLLETARKKTQKNGQRLIWYTPTQYCNFDPVQMELGVKGCTAALYNMCIEPDGKVLPCQSYYTPVGDFLADDWDVIWNNDLCIRLRERQDLPIKCEGCELLAECGGGCPLQFETNPEQHSL